ncbi:MAG: LysR family transcriptional regulator [Myxococcota bacterium]
MPAEAPPLDGLDLNLLVTLRALLVEGSVTRAAARLGQSQPTVSRALQSLRATFADELLTRSGRAMTRTPMAEALLEPVERFLNAANRLATVGSFDPSTARRTFHISLPDMVSVSVVPSLTARVVTRAPGCTLFVSGGERDQLAGLLSGELDMAVGAELDHGELMRRVVGRDDRWVVVVGEGHPCYAGELGLQDWLTSKHMQLNPHGRPAAPSAVEVRLRELGHHRTISVKLGHVAALPSLLRSTSLVVSLPRSMAVHVAAGAGLQIHPHPLGEVLPAPTLSIAWHESMQRDAGHAWLRQQLVEAF